MYADIEIDLGCIPENLLSLADPVEIPIEIESENDVSEILEEQNNPLDNFCLGSRETMLIDNMPQVENLTLAPR